MAIVINGSGTVTGLAVGGLPDGTVDAGTLATNSVDSAELIDGAIDTSHLASGVGGIAIQHRYSSTRTQYVSTSTTAAAVANLAVTITPTDATNNLLVTVGVAINRRQTATGTRLWLYRDIGGAGFTIMDGIPIIYYGGYGNEDTISDAHNNVFFQYLDSGYDSTSVVTYKLYYALSNGSGTVKINSNGSLSTITATEHKV